MGKHRDLETRLTKARRMAEGNRKGMERHHKRATRCNATGQHDKAKTADALYERAKRLEKKWSREVTRLERQIRTLRLLTDRAPASHPHTTPTPLSPKEQKRQALEAKAEVARAETKRKRMKAAGLEHWDPRTANGDRQVDVVNLGPSLRASLNHFTACIKKRSDRTNARVLAWSKFDEHCHRVHGGLIANPRFEPGVDSSKTPGVADSRLDAMREDAKLRAWLGRDMHGLLVEVVYFHKRFRELDSTAAIGEHAIAVMFRRALDLAANYWGLSEDNSFGRAMNIATWRVDAATGA